MRLRVGSAVRVRTGARGFRIRVVIRLAAELGPRARPAVGLVGNEMHGGFAAVNARLVDHLIHDIRLLSNGPVQ